MADSDDTQAGDEPTEYMNERQLVAARFIALGGGSTIDMDLAKMPVLADLVTEQHRSLVRDLAAQGLSNEAVARIMGISKERLQTLFAFELGTAFELSKASLARAAYWRGIAGDVQAMALWLRNHNRSDWAATVKTEKTDKGAGQDEALTNQQLAAGNDMLARLLTDLSQDATKYKRPNIDKLPPVKVVQSEKPKLVKPKSLKRVKGD